MKILIEATTPAKRNKIRQQILQTVLSLEIVKGHLKWKISDLARLAKASRAVVYYHFGKTKEDILHACVEMIASDYYGLNEDRVDSLKRGEGFESLLRTREIFLRHPEFVVFYQKWRMQASPLRTLLLRFEKRYQAKLQAAYPHLTEPEVLAVHAIFHGLVTAPFATKEAIRVAWEQSLHPLMRK